VFLEKLCRAFLSPHLGGKNLRKKSAKKRFLFSHEYRDQKTAVKKRAKFFPETNEYCEKKVGKKLTEKTWE